MKAISYNLSIERSSDEILISQVFGDEYSAVRITSSMINLVCEQLQALKQTEELNLPFQRESSAKEKGFPSFDDLKVIGEKEAPVTLTPELIRAGLTGGVGINKLQQDVLGIKELSSGWQKRLIGKEISASEYRKFLALKGATSR